MMDAKKEFLDSISQELADFYKTNENSPELEDLLEERLSESQWILYIKYKENKIRRGRLDYPPMTKSRMEEFWGEQLTDEQWERYKKWKTGESEVATDSTNNPNLAKQLDGIYVMHMKTMTRMDSLELHLNSLEIKITENDMKNETEQKQRISIETLRNDQMSSKIDILEKKLEEMAQKVKQTGSVEKLPKKSCKATENKSTTTGTLKLKNCMQHDVIVECCGASKPLGRKNIKSGGCYCFDLNSSELTAFVLTTDDENPHVFELRYDAIHKVDQGGSKSTLFKKWYGHQ